MRPEVVYVWIFFGLFLATLSFMHFSRIRFTTAKPYQIRASFPPLVILPDYQKGPPVHASAALLLETQSGAVLYAKNAEERRAPASTTKMMTAIVALECGDLNKVVEVSPRAARTPGSSIYLRPKDRLKLKELLKGMMLQSGNDGSMAVAEGVSGSVENFVRLMNRKAKEIGALNTNFRNPHGLRAPSHYTTVLDLALIARYGLTNPVFADLVQQKQAVLEWMERRRQLEVRNTNRLLWYLEGADGVKTGTTNEAGHCLVASATRDGKQFIAVVLNSRDRWGDCQRLLEYGFREFVIVKVAAARQPAYRIPVKDGADNFVKVYPRRDLVAVVRKGQADGILRKITIFKEPVAAPLRIAQTLGRIGYQFQGRMVEGVDLVNREPVPVKKRFWRFFE